MKQTSLITSEQAMRRAMDYAGLTDAESFWTLDRYEDGLYALSALTLYQRYEFYMDATTGEVLGVNSEPLPYPEMLLPGSRAIPAAPLAA